METSTIVAVLVNQAISAAAAEFEHQRVVACNDSQSDVIRWGIVLHQLEDASILLDGMVADTTDPREE